MSELDDLNQLRLFDSQGLLARAAAWPNRRDAARPNAALPATATTAWLCLLPPELLPLGHLAASTLDNQVDASGSPVWIYPAPVRRGSHPAASLAAVDAGSLQRLGPDPSEAQLKTLLADAPTQPLTEVANAERHLTDILFDLINLFSQASSSQPLFPARWLSQPDTALDSALATLAPPIDTANNPAKQLALRLHERLPIFSGTGPMAHLAALWAMRQQWYAERAAFAMSGAEVARLGVLARLPRYWPNTVYFVELASAYSDAELTSAVTHILSRRRFPTESIALPSGLSDQAALVYLLELGEWVALYAAYLLQADPVAHTAHKILFEP